MTHLVAVEEYADVSMMTNVGSLTRDEMGLANGAIENLPSKGGEVVPTVLMATGQSDDGVLLSPLTEENFSPVTEPDNVSPSTGQNILPVREPDNDVSSPSEGRVIVGDSPSDALAGNDRDRADNESNGEEVARAEDTSLPNVSPTTQLENPATIAVNDRPTIASSASSIYLDAGENECQTEEKNKAKKPMRLTNVSCV